MADHYVKGLRFAKPRRSFRFAALEIQLLRYGREFTLKLMLGFVSTDNDALVACLGDPQRTVAAYRELLRRGQDALGAIRNGLSHAEPAVREGCCRLLDHLVDTESMGLLIAMVDDPDAQVRIAAFHALACDRCKDDACAPGADRVLAPALAHLTADPDPQVRARAAELVGKFAHADGRAVAALQAAHRDDPSPSVRKKAGWYAPGGTIYERTAASGRR